MFKFAKLFVFAFSINIFSQILELDKLNEIFNFIKEPDKTLVIFDIDNTLVCPENELGADEWFYYMVNKKMQKEGLDYLGAVIQSLPKYYYAQFHIPLIPVEKNISETLQKLMGLNIKFIALTARAIYLAERTFDQLFSLNIKFGFLRDKTISLNLMHPALFKQGILFSGNNDKGDALIALLDFVDFHPEYIIFADDKHKNLLSVEDAALKRQIHFTGIRYSGCDEKVKKFDPAKARELYLELRRKNR